MSNTPTTTGLATLVVGVLASPAVQACSVCFGDPNSDMAHGVNTGVLFLLMVIAGVLAVFAALMMSWIRRAAEYEQHPE
jgi:uncharacterized protein (DUF983 family)